MENIEIVKVTNDAMFPGIEEGGYAIIDTSKTEIIEALHAISYGGFIEIKRLQFKMSGKIEVFIDNKLSSSHQRETFTKEELKPFIYGRVIHIIN